jgi:hypothetical protein
MYLADTGGRKSLKGGGIKMRAKNSIPILDLRTHEDMLQMQLPEKGPLPSKKLKLDLTEVGRNERNGHGERGKILVQYALANSFMRMHLFLQFPDLRHSFQEIDRKDLAAEKASLTEEHRGRKRS